MLSRLVARRSSPQVLRSVQFAATHSDVMPEVKERGRAREDVKVAPHAPRTWSESARDVDRMMSELAKEKVSGMSKKREAGKLSPTTAQRGTTVQHLTEREERMWSARTAQMIKERFKHGLQESTGPLGRRVHSEAKEAEP